MGPEQNLADLQAHTRKKSKEEKARVKAQKKVKAAKKADLRAQMHDVTNRLSQYSSAAGSSARAPVLHVGQAEELIMASSYDPCRVEASWYKFWEQSGCFAARDDSAQHHRPPFVMVLPPPNVTGALHIGHALTATIQDTLARWRRMSGFNVLWLPGLDHAGIATQVVVEKKLMKEKGMTRHDLGREKFVQEVWKWTEQYGDTICNQLRQIGSSLDWSRQCFTMDAKRAEAVVEAFVRLHGEGLIYRNNRLVNWDCTLRTAISDIEVDYKELEGRTLISVPGYSDPVEFGVMYSFAYPIEGGQDKVEVATTRPETMLGDMAIAVHPDDHRYTHLHGKFAIHPFDGRQLPILCDRDLVDMDFGTGAVKITPAHDAMDFACGQCHNLPVTNIFTDDGKINNFGGDRFAGLGRFEARKAVLEALMEKGLYRGSIENAMKIGVCSRTGDVIEPLIKPQWYVKCGSLAAMAKKAVESGELRIVPERFQETWHRWLDNIQDWCISRQLWWGHRVPAWYVTLEDDESKEMGAYNDHWVVDRDKPAALEVVRERFPGRKFRLDQDPDVLDTWFSSAIFPFAAVGWPNDIPSLRLFYPTSVLETGHDILFFWVARIVMLGIKLTAQVPFKQVYLHAMVRDAEGRKMSKSLGNVINPLDVVHGAPLGDLHRQLEESGLDKREVEKGAEGLKANFPKGIPRCGADALRFSLVAYSRQEVSMNLDIKIVEGYRRWCNKIWNAVRFAKLYFGEDFLPPPKHDLNLSSLPFSCQWILSVLNGAIQSTVHGLEGYDIAAAAMAVHSWWFYSLCGIFIELAKPILSGDAAARDVKRGILDTLWLCVEMGLRLLHPFMPYISEELWQKLPGCLSGSQQTIMLEPYPNYREDWSNKRIEGDMAVVDKIACAARSSRGGQLKQRGELYVVCKDQGMSSLVKERETEILTLAKVARVEVLRTEEEVPLGSCAAVLINEHISTHLLFPELN